MPEADRGAACLFSTLAELCAEDQSEDTPPQHNMTLKPKGYTVLETTQHNTHLHSHTDTHTLSAYKI